MESYIRMIFIYNVELKESSGDRIGRHFYFIRILNTC